MIRIDKAAENEKLKRQLAAEIEKQRQLQNQSKTEKTYIVEKVIEREKIIYVPVPVPKSPQKTLKP